MKETLEVLLKSAKDKKILVLGKASIFSKDEIKKFLKKYKIEMTTHYEEGVVASIEHHQLNPVEEDISCMIYDDNIPAYDLEDFEMLVSKGLNEDEILMIIKLSNDTQRVLRLLVNPNITHSLFVKLLDIYIWDSVDEDNRDDRDVIIAMLRRYIKIRPNEEDLLYSYLTLRRLATEAVDNKLLLAMTRMPNFDFLIRNKPKTSLLETIARNKSIQKDTIKKLLSFRKIEVEVALASNPCVPLETLLDFISKNTPKIEEALAINLTINTEIFEKLLDKSDYVLSLLLTHQEINSQRYALVKKENIALLGVNEHLDAEVIEALILIDNEDLLANLSSNETLSLKQLLTIYGRNNPKLFSHLGLNKNLNQETIKKLYEINDKEIHISLAHNTNTSTEILKMLFAMECLEINRGLASNCHTPLDILDILKVDTRLRNDLTKNALLMAEVNTKLDY